MKRKFGSMGEGARRSVRVGKVRASRSRDGREAALTHSRPNEPASADSCTQGPRAEGSPSQSGSFSNQALHSHASIEPPQSGNAPLPAQRAPIGQRALSKYVQPAPPGQRPTLFLSMRCSVE